MSSKSKIVLVNLWGLGDLIPTLNLIHKNNKKSYHIITPHKKIIVSELISVFDIRSNITFCSSRTKVFLIIEIIRNIFLRRTIIFTAPLADNSRLLANFLAKVYSKIILTKEYGNIYELNEEINISKYL